MSSTANRMSHTTRVVVAIDFGTSRSGYAYAFVDDPDIKHNLKWPGSPLPYYKTLTELLYSPTKNVMAWGFEAQRVLANMTRAEAKDYSLLRTFKMNVHNHANAIREVPNGVTFLIQQVVTDFLRSLKDYALAQIKDVTGGQLRDDEVLWCLTVPAIWSDGDKSRMRTAAFHAGIIEEEDSERLLLVLEPEAAAIYCQDIAQFALSPGQKFMIVDCGGGTVDITVHEISSYNALLEVVPGTGGAYGSTFVDRSFVRYLERKIGEGMADEFERENPQAFLNLMETWERIKLDFGPVRDEKDVQEEEWKKNWSRKFQFGAAFYKFLYQKCPDVLEALEDEQGQGADDYLELDYSVMENIFDSVTTRIADKVQAVLHALEANGKRCDYLLLVGGFAESPFLQEIIKKQFAGSVGHIVVPSYPGAAVVQGAVAFGLDPYRIRSRCSRLTYGWRCVEKFNPRKHVGRNSRMINGEPYCDHVFAPIVRAGESVEVDKLVSRRACPVFPDQVELEFTFYASGNPKCKYTDEDGVEALGAMMVKMPDTTGGIQREVEVKAYFGRTEIEVEATDLTSGNTAQASLKFSSTFSSELLGGNHVPT